jgi:transposase
MSYWAAAPMPREQIVLIPITLDDRIPENHPVRLLDEILAGYDWSEWKAQYHGKRGQPPIPPRVLASLWFYALRLGIRSSRRLEYMATHNVDFLWLSAGHAPDHSTLSKFRMKFKKPLKDLFRYVALFALKAGYLSLVDVAMDGTRVRANNSRHQTWTTAALEKALAELTTKFEMRLAAADDADAREQELGGDVLAELPPDLADLQERRDKLAAIQAELKELEAARRKEGIDPQENPAQIPKHDPDSRILPNKEKGYAPNYTPLATTEGQGGYIVDADVIVGPCEHQDLLPSIERITESFGQKPKQALADGAFATGPNIVGMEQLGVDFFSPVSIPPQLDNPALRADPTQPVPEADWPKLPMDPQTKKLHKSCFTYDTQQDLFYCPLGHPLTYTETKSEIRRGEKSTWRVYQSASCAGCPLKGMCVSDRNRSGQRTVSRDPYTAERERQAAKMRTPEAQAAYNRRMWIAETPFGTIKQMFGLRQFLLRGLEKVKTEWLWTCTAFNLTKLMRDLEQSRAATAVGGASAVAN